MLGITDRAAIALRSIATSKGAAPLVRIHSDPPASPDGSTPRFRVELISAPEPGDETVPSPEGVEIWLAASAIAFLNDKVLDSEPDSRGWPTFVLHAA